jgi:uncharacterized protein (DUF362 family)/NAD-dependent dihydropyrimidine dehydrogenase PreA subunit
MRLTKLTERERVAVQRISDDRVEQAVFAALEALGAKRLLPRSGLKVLIKPNVLIAKPPERAATTHPLVLGAVIKWVLQFAPGRVVVGDSSGGRAPGTTEWALEITGMKAVCDHYGVECLPLEKTERAIYWVDNPGRLDHFASTALLGEVDLIINLPKIKTHEMCTMTCAVKNLYGTILLANKLAVHAMFTSIPDFGGALVDIYSVARPQLTVVDGYLCQEGNGPSAGDVVKLDLIVAGFNGVAVDAVVCDIIDIPVSEVLYLPQAHARGLGPINLDEIEVVGESLSAVRRPFKRPKNKGVSIALPRFLANYAARTLFRSTIRFDPQKCVLCGACWRNCPVEAITPPALRVHGEVPLWSSQKCITCYCCPELCPHEAVEFEVNLVRNAFTSGLAPLLLLAGGGLVWLLFALLF